MNQRWIYMYSPCRSPLPPPFCMCWEECVLRTIHIKYIWHLGEICKNAGTFCVCKLCYWLFWYSLSAWKYKVCQKLRWHRYLKNSSFMKTLNSGSSHSGLSFPTEFWVFSPGGGGDCRMTSLTYDSSALRVGIRSLPYPSTHPYSTSHASHPMVQVQDPSSSLHSSKRVPPSSLVGRHHMGRVCF